APGRGRSRALPYRLGTNSRAACAAHQPPGCRRELPAHPYSVLDQRQSSAYRSDTNVLAVSRDPRTVSRDPRRVRKAADMGEVVGAGLLAQVFDVLDYDTVVVLDSHWATTVEYVVSAQDRRAGLFTSEELPRGMSRVPYDYPGDPELARAMAARADDRGTWVTAIDDPYLPVMYATINLWHYLGRGLPDKRWVSVSTCQTG